MVALVAAVGQTGKKLKQQLKIAWQHGDFHNLKYALMYFIGLILSL